MNYLEFLGERRYYVHPHITHSYIIPNTDIISDYFYARNLRIFDYYSVVYLFTPVIKYQYGLPHYLHAFDFDTLFIKDDSSMYALNELVLY